MEESDQFNIALTRKNTNPSLGVAIVNYDFLTFVCGIQGTLFCIAHIMYVIRGWI